MRQFLPNAVQICFCIFKLLCIAIDEIHPTDQRLIGMVDLLLVQVVAQQVRLIISRHGIAAQAVFVMLRFYDVAIILRPAARYFAAVFVAKVPHGGKVFQNRFPQRVNDLLEFCFELR